MSKKKDDCMEEQPGWYNGQFLDEVGFCCEVVCRHPMVCVGGKFFSKEGRIYDENGSKKEIYEMLRPYLKSGLAKKCSNLLEMLRMEAYKDNLPVHEDRLHVANGTLFVRGEFSEHKEFCRNRLPVKYNPDAPQPVTWLHFLSELLEDEDILTLQEYLGYCLIPTTRGQTMMLLKGNGGEGKSRIGVVMQAVNCPADRPRSPRLGVAAGFRSGRCSALGSVRRVPSTRRSCRPQIMQGRHTAL